MPQGELRLKFKAAKDCRITLYGAELGGPIYKVYDRQSGALLDTIVISPAIWTESGQQISDENFPDRTYHPNKYVVGEDQYSGLVVESRGASEQVQVRCGPAPPPPSAPPRGRVRRDGQEPGLGVAMAPDVKYGGPWMVTESTWRELIPSEQFDALARRGVVAKLNAIRLVDETDPPGNFGGLSPWYPSAIIDNHIPAAPGPGAPAVGAPGGETLLQKWRREEIELQKKVWDEFDALDKRAQKGVRPLHADFRESRDPNAPPGWGFSGSKPIPHWYLDPIVASFAERLIIPPHPRQAQVDPDPGLPWDGSVILTTTTISPGTAGEPSCCNPKGSWYWERLEIVNGVLKPVDWKKHAAAGTKPVYPEDLTSIISKGQGQVFGVPGGGLGIESGTNNRWDEWMLEEARKHVADPEYAPWFADAEIIENYNTFNNFLAADVDEDGIPQPRPPEWQEAYEFLSQNVYPRYEQAAKQWWSSYKNIWLELEMLPRLHPQTQDPNAGKQIPNHKPEAERGRKAICPTDLDDGTGSHCLVLKHKNDPDLEARLMVSGVAIQDETGAMVIPTAPERERKWPPIIVNGRPAVPLPRISSEVRPNYGEYPVVVDYDRDHDDEEFEICFKVIDAKWVAFHWTIDPAIDILSMGQLRDLPVKVPFGGPKQIRQRILYVKDLKVGDKGQGWEVCKCCPSSTTTTTPLLPTVTTTIPPLVQPLQGALNDGKWFWNNDNDNFLSPFNGIPQKNMAFWLPVLGDGRNSLATRVKWENLREAYVPLIGGRLRLRLRGRGPLPEVKIGPMAGKGRAAQRFGREYLRRAGYPDPAPYKEPTGAELEDPDYFKNAPSRDKHPCPAPWPWFWTKAGWRKAVPGGVAEQPYWPFPSKGRGPKPTGEEMIDRWFETAMPPAIPAGGVPRRPASPVGGDAPGRPLMGQNVGGPGIFEGGINPFAGADPNIRVPLPQAGWKWRGEGDPFEGGPPWYKWDGLFFLQWIPVGWPCPEEPSTPEDWKEPDGILSPGRWDHLWESPLPPNWIQGLEGVDFWREVPT